MKKLALLLLLNLSILAVAKAQRGINRNVNYAIYNRYSSARDERTDLYYFYKVDTSGNRTPITKPLYEKTESFHDGLAMAKKNGKYGFVDTLGAETVEFKYDNTNDFTNNVAIVFYDCKTGIVDTKGNLILLDKDYEQVFNFSENRAVVVSKNKYGVIDKKGNEVVPTNYYRISSYHSGVSVYKGGLFFKEGVIDTMGNEIVPCFYNNITDFINGLAVVSRSVNKNGKDKFDGLIDNRGNIVIPVEYTALFKGEHKYGWYDYDDENKDGKIIAVRLKHNKRYDYYDIGDKRRIEKTILYDEKGNNLLTVPNKVINYIHDNLYYYNYNKSVVLVNQTGPFDTLQGIKYVDYHNYDDQYLVTEGYNKKEGLLTYDGKVLFPPKFDYITSFDTAKYFRGSIGDTTVIYNSTTLAPVVKYSGVIYGIVYNLSETDKPSPDTQMRIINNKNKYGLIDGNLKIVLPVVYDEISIYNKLIVYKKDGKYGALNNQLKSQISPIYDKIILPQNAYSSSLSKSNQQYSFLIVKKDKKYEVINKLGQSIVNTEYNNVTRCWINNAEYFYVKKDKLWGIIDSTGKIYIDIKYSHLYANGNFISAYQNHKAALLKISGQPITGFDYTDINIRNGDNNIAVYNKNKSGLIDSTGRLLFPVKYKYIYLSNGYVHCAEKGISSLYYPSGKVAIGPEHGFTNISAELSPQIFAVYKGKKIGMAKTDNTIVLPAIY